jgi:anti-sigma regulatory factor (Ser/Thr protein kinase)
MSRQMIRRLAGENACAGRNGHDGAGDAAMDLLQEPAGGNAGAYRHEAFLYSGMAEYLAGTLSFISRAVDAAEPVLVVVSSPKIEMLRRELGGLAGQVSFADMAEAGANPARVIAVWRRFAAAADGAARRWGISELADPGRSPEELAECQLDEALLNVAFGPSVLLGLMCPYDVAALPAGVIDGARRIHPFVVSGQDREATAAYRPVEPDEPFSRLPPPRPADAAAMRFEPGGLGRVRLFVADHARRAGVAERCVPSLVAAVNEIATNSLQHGGGRGELHLWADGKSLVCEVTDQGQLTEPLAGLLPPDPYAGAGLWLANQSCDLVQIFRTPDGTTIRVHQKL